MTADDLRALVKRHTEETARLTAYAAKAGVTPEQALAFEHCDPFCAQDYRDIRDLVSLVRQMAEMNPVRTVSPCGGPRTMCIACEAEADEGAAVTHGPDCLWLISQGAKP